MIKLGKKCGLLVGIITNKNWKDNGNNIAEMQ